MQLQPGVDMVVRFERAQGRRMRREPTWRARRDALYGQHARQLQRARDVTGMWSSIALAWVDILCFRGRFRFIPSFLRFLQYQ